MPVLSYKEADLIVINTCSVREHAENRLFGYIRSLKHWKSSNGSILAVGGCVPERVGQDMVSMFPHIDIVFGTKNFSSLPSLLMQNKTENKRVIKTNDDDRTTLQAQHVEDDSPRVFLPIIRGCTNYCTYCVVPYTRGPEISRPLEGIIKNVRILAKSGLKEVTLLGQNVNCYGNDLAKTDLFATLLYRLNEIDSLRRIRFLTSNPKDISDKTIEAISSNEKVCQYIHIPVQSGSDRILKRMNRRYTASDYLKLIDRIRKYMPDAAISTDVILGFPGEQASDFNETIRIINKVCFDNAYVFIYSPRPGTKAANYDDTVSSAETHRRFDELIGLQKNICLKNNKKMVGKALEVFVEGNSKRGDMLTGRTTTNKVVNFKGKRDLVDSFVRIDIKEAGPFSLKGEICGAVE